MLRRMLGGAAVGAMVLVAGCGAEPKKLNATPNSVTYSYEDEELATITQAAMTYCTELGKSAKMRSVDEVDDDKVAIFDCV